MSKKKKERQSTLRPSKSILKLQRTDDLKNNTDSDFWSFTQRTGPVKLQGGAFSVIILLQKRDLKI